MCYRWVFYLRLCLVVKYVVGFCRLEFVFLFWYDICLDFGKFESGGVFDDERDSGVFWVSVWGICGVGSLVFVCV